MRNRRLQMVAKDDTATVQSAELQQMARMVFGTPQGERILNQILDVYCAVEAPAGPMSAEAANYRNGARDVGVRIKELVYGQPIKTVTGT